jgi:hypothetical protein
MPAMDVSKTLTPRLAIAFAGPAFARPYIPSSILVNSLGGENEIVGGEKTLETRGKAATLKFIPANVPVAQLDRASASGAEGYRFNSCRAY